MNAKWLTLGAGRWHDGHAVKNPTETRDEDGEDTGEDTETLVGEVVEAGDERAQGAAREQGLSVLNETGLAVAAERDPMSAFMTQLRQFPLLTEEQERELGRRIRDEDDPEAVKAMVMHNLRLVVTIAWEFRRRWANVRDLVQEGSMGLVVAARKWDPDHGARFGTYAGYWIRAYVMKFILDNAKLVGVGGTRAGRKLFFRLEKERRALLNEGTEPTDENIAARLGVSVQEVRDVSRSLAPVVPFDVPRASGDGEGRTLADTLGDDSAGDPEENAERSQRSERLRDVIEAFSATLTDPREKAIWQEHLLAEEPASLSELGARFNLTKQRMGQLATSLRKRFRDLMVERFGPDAHVSW